MMFTVSSLNIIVILLVIINLRTASTVSYWVITNLLTGTLIIYCETEFSLQYSNKQLSKTHNSLLSTTSSARKLSNNSLSIYQIGSYFSPMPRPLFLQVFLRWVSLNPSPVRSRYIHPCQNVSEFLPLTSGHIKVTI